jgi:hypothetical protein
MSVKDKSEAIILIEKLRLVESELFRLSSKYGIKTIDDFDKLLEKGKLTEEAIGEDFFRFDYLLSEKKLLEKQLEKLSIPKERIWDTLQDLLDLRKLSLKI